LNKLDFDSNDGAQLPPLDLFRSPPELVGQGSGVKAAFINAFCSASKAKWTDLPVQLEQSLEWSTARRLSSQECNL